MATDRRFFVLLTSALTALLVLGLIPGRAAGPYRPPSGDVPVHALASETWERPKGPAGASEIEALRPPGILQPLLLLRLAERFPELAQVHLPEWPTLEHSQVISYYGNPYSADMGILGADDIESVATQLEEQAERYDELNGSPGAVPALHLVYAVAQAEPTDNGLFLQYVDDAQIEELLALTAERGLLLFLDLQIGRSTVEAELEKVLPYLRHPQVHLAIDPEFAMEATEVPGIHLGKLLAADIDRAQAMLQELVQAERLPPKLLIVHQFVDSMMPDGDAIKRYPGVELIIDMDGFGPAEIKRVKYERFAARPYASHAAIKLFFDYDPDLMSEEDVLSLEPRPAVIIYQ